MKLSEAEDARPPAAMSSQPSPTAAQLAAFSPFTSLASSSGPIDTGSLGFRKQYDITSPTFCGPTDTGKGWH